MADIIRWGSERFYVKSSRIRGVKDLKITGSSETEKKSSGKNAVTKRKNAAPFSITMTAVFDARLNVDVKSAATKLLKKAQDGKTGYFYTGGKKLFKCAFMLTKAEAQNIQFTPAGGWLCCEVSMTLNQSSKGGISGSSGNKKKKKQKTNNNPSKPFMGLLILNDDTDQTPATQNTLSAQEQSANILAEANAPGKVPAGPPARTPIQMTAHD